jgi:hypothetical protein
MDTVLALWGALCRVDVTAQAGWALAGALFAGGAAGSPLHCVPMCGGFVLGQVADRMARLPAIRLCEWRRVSGAALVPYHLGRLTTYAALGALAGLGGGVLTQLPGLGRLSGMLLLGAAVLFLGHALRRLAPSAIRWVPGGGSSGKRTPGVLLHAVRRLDRTRPASGYLLGVALGFLPCGFLYAALTASTASATPTAGALGMAAFGLGTAPALMVAGFVGQAAGRRFSSRIAQLAPTVLLANAAILVILAWRSFSN